MAEATLPIHALDIRVVRGQARPPVTLVDAGLAWSGPFTAVVGDARASMSSAVSTSGDDVLITLSATQAAMVGERWRLLSNGVDVLGGRILEATTSGAGDAVSITVDVADDAGDPVVITVQTIEVVGEGGGLTEDDVAPVALTGSYGDLTDTPTIPATPGDLGAATAAQGATADSAVQPGDLAAVATSGAYVDLSGRPTLGTAAAQPTSAFDAAGAASSAVSTHEGDTDPHGDRAYADGIVGALDANAVGAVPVLGTGDVELPPADYATVPGEVAGGVLTQVQSVDTTWSYTLAVDTDEAASALGTAHRVLWDVDISASPGLSSPAVQSHDFGPRGVWNNEGSVRYLSDMGPLTGPPIAFSDMLVTSNDSGNDRLITPAWHFMATPTFAADNGELSFQAGDTNSGGASFVSTKSLVTANAGTVDASNIALTGFLAAEVIIGNVTLGERVAYDGVGLKFGSDLYYGGPTTIRGAFNAGGPASLRGIIDAAGGESVVSDIIYRARQPAHGTHRLGHVNHGGYAAPPSGSTLSSASSTIRRDAETVILSNTSGGALTLNASPIAAGYDGQRLTLVLGSGDRVHIPAGGTMAEAVSLLVVGDTVQLRYIQAAGTWSIDRVSPAWLRVQTGTSTSAPAAPTIPGITLNRTTGAGGGTFVDILGASDQSSSQSLGLRSFVFGETVARMSMTAAGFVLTDGADALNGTYVTRSAAGVLRVASLLGTLQTVLAMAHKGAHEHGGITAITATSYDVPLSAYGNLITRSNASASTQAWRRDSLAAFPVGAKIETINLGAGTVTHSATSPATLTTGSATSQPQGKTMVATKVAADTWHLSVSA